jgi:NADH-quinone oxidoreductase subunit A
MRSTFDDLILPENPKRPVPAAPGLLLWARKSLYCRSARWRALTGPKQKTVPGARGKIPPCPGRERDNARGAMSSSAYLPILIQIALALLITGGVIAASQLVGQKFKPNKIKDTAYECGVPSESISRTRFSVKFYVTAMLFILFDIEVVFLIPWTFVYRDFLANHIAILTPMLFFLGVLVLGLFYEVRKGALEWEK